MKQLRHWEVIWYAQGETASEMQGKDSNTFRLYILYSLHHSISLSLMENAGISPSFQSPASFSYLFLIYNQIGSDIMRISVKASTRLWLRISWYLNLIDCTTPELKVNTELIYWDLNLNLHTLSLPLYSYLQMLWNTNNSVLLDNDMSLLGSDRTGTRTFV